MTKIMVIDTQGSAITDEYRALLPGISIVGVEPESTRGTPCHPHGALCGWLAALPSIGARLQDVELIFVRMFDTDARPIEGAHKFILDAIEASRPNYISRSWGAWDFDSPYGRMFAEQMFSDFLPRFVELQKDIGFVDFGAAGNSDKNDADQDVDAPQSMLQDTFIVGACRRDGVATEWSGDGKGVSCVMWADGVYSPDINGKWTLWSGTSAATPKLCGAAAARLWNRDRLRDALVNLGPDNRPRGEWILPHPKFGHGCAEGLWQFFAHAIPAPLLPPHGHLGGEMIEFFDYTRELRRAAS